MTFTVLDVEQRSPEWFKARCGRVTGSRAGDIFSTRKDGKESAARRDYRTQLALERFLSRPLDDCNGYQNADMRRGVELEPEAFAVYEATRGVIVRRTGFVACDDMPVGVSLDGDIEDFTGLLELKCPRPAIHLSYFRAGTVPTEYLPQIVHGQMVTGAQWTDFVSYCPAFPSELELFMVRVPRDDKQIHAYRLGLNLFLSEVDREVDELRALMSREPVPA